MLCLFTPFYVCVGRIFCHVYLWVSWLSLLAALIPLVVLKRLETALCFLEILTGFCWKRFFPLWDISRERLWSVTALVPVSCLRLLWFLMLPSLCAEAADFSGLDAGLISPCALCDPSLYFLLLIWLTVALCFPFFHPFLCGIVLDQPFITYSMPCKRYLLILQVHFIILVKKVNSQI